MNTSTVSAPATNHKRAGFFVLLFCLAGTLSLLFLSSFDFSRALFANDGPFGSQMAKPYVLPGAFFGIWNDLYWLGADNGNYSPNFTGGLLFLLGSRAFINFYAPFTALVLGLCAWVFFRQLRFGPMVCVLGGLAAALNMNFFSNACWGLGSRGLSLGCIFLALAAIQSSFSRFTILKTVLAGLAIGLSLSEGGDNGAIFAIFTAFYAFFVAVTQEGPWALNATKGVGRVAIMVVCSVILAFSMLNVFINAAIKGKVGAKQEEMTAEQRWDWATQWSLPKLETLRVIIPGIHGYRLDTANGGNYWGAVGRQPGWEQHHQGFPRHSGAGEYAGVLVVLVAAWSLANSLSKKSCAYKPDERRAIQFWGAMALIALLLAWGRYALFYRIVYVLPFFSSIRNPMKFMHPFHMILMILFAYGLNGLSRRYLETATLAVRAIPGQAKSWWGRAAGFEKTWNWSALAVVALSAVGYLAYNASSADLARYLTTVGFDDPRFSEQIARFSISEVGLFVLFLAASVGVLMWIQSGALTGKRSVWAGLFLGVILVVDLGRADKPWIQYFDIQQKYATNPVLDVLKEKPWEQRVTVPGFQVPGQAAQANGMLQQMYHIEWLQHHFQLFNIQAIEVAQMPRVPEDYAAFNKAVAGQQLRLWQLTNTRYIIALDGFTEALNMQLDPQKRRFKERLRFSLEPKPGVAQARTLEDLTAVVSTNGSFGLIEFTGTLPRARLYAQWQVSTNDDAALKTLGDAAFDPEQNVVVDDPVSASNLVTANATMAAVEISHYSPRKIELRADAATSAVLLLNNRYDANWKALVDGKPASLLRCNFVMQGVQVPAGRHTVVFQFAPPVNGFWLMLGCVIFGLLLCGVLLVAEKLKKPTDV